MKDRWVIADIHGEYEKLERLLDLIEYDLKTHQLIFLGDMIDRGANSKAVIIRLMQLQEEGAIVLRGNHERMMINYCDTKNYRDTMLWMQNGGNETVHSYGKNKALMFAHAQWIRTLPLWYEDDQYFYSHAPLPPYLDKYIKESDGRAAWADAKSDEDILTWSYFHPESDAFTIPGKIGICGHVHALFKGVFTPRLYGHYYFMDAGCGCHPDAQLYALNLENMEMRCSDVGAE